METNAGNGVVQNREHGMAHAIEEHDESVKPGQRPEPPRATRGDWSECEAERYASRQSNEPLAELERRHGEPRPALAHCEDGRVVHVKETTRGFVDHVKRESHGECKLGAPETGRRRGLLRHGIHLRSNSGLEWPARTIDFCLPVGCDRDHE